jgi:alpha-1,2-glucosyltransferase
MSKTPNEAFWKDFNLLKMITKVYKEDLSGKKLLFADLEKIIDLTTVQPFLFTFLTFGFFVFVNKGIVVGDRENHEVSLHLVQIFYFVSFSCFFSLSSYLFAPKKFKNLLAWFRSSYKFIFLVGIPICCVIIRNFTYEHPFLLADNRHYTFYIWSKLFRRHELIKYGLIPVYLTCVYLFYRNLTLTGKSISWLIVYSICSFTVLVPQKLLEFRYFIVPFYLYRLNINQTTLKEVIVEIFLNGLINFVTIYIFFYKTFYWPNDPVEVQRFMW